MCNAPGLRVGLDLCGIARMEELVRDKCFLNRYFTQEEAEYIASKHAAAAQTMAGIFAAKEAFVKALGVGISLPMKDVGITHAQTGQPCYALSGRAKEMAGDAQCALSITHEGDTAAAVCIMLG